MKYEIACKSKVCMYAINGECTRNPTYDMSLTPNSLLCKGLVLKSEMVHR